LRNLYEKTANFLGYPRWSELLPGDKQAYLNRIIQSTSHSTLSNETVAELTEPEKQTVKLLLTHLTSEYRFWQELEASNRSGWPAFGSSPMFNLGPKDQIIDPGVCLGGQPGNVENHPFLCCNIIHLAANIAYSMYPRSIEAILADALSDTPVVLLNGARQTGKSTLAQVLRPGIRYLTLEAL